MCADGNEFMTNNEPLGNPEEFDDLYQEAIKIVRRDNKCSTSHLQRELRCSYGRAVGIIDRMEREGAVSAADWRGFRKVEHVKSDGCKSFP